MRKTATALALLAATFSMGAAGPTDDRTHGEGDRVERRREWFFSTRRAGTASPGEMAVKRAAAARDTLRAIEAERARRGAAAAPTWASRGPSPSNFGGWSFGPVAGRVPALARGGDGALYAGTASGGLWRSTDGGLSWTSLFDRAGTMTVGAVAVDPADPSVIWAGTGENTMGCETYFGIGLLRSTDGGQTWEARNGSGSGSLEDLSTVADVVVDPRDSSHVVVGGRLRGCGSGSVFPGGIYTSQDSGATWTQRLVDEFVHGVHQSPQAPDVWWASTSRGVFRSEDDARTWTLQTASGLPWGSTGRTEVAIAPSDDRVVYALFQTGIGGTAELWRTGDRGLTWTRQSLGSAACDGQCSYNMVLKVKVDDPAVLYRGTVRLFKSVNSGATWSDLSGPWGPNQRVHQDTHALLLDPADSQAVWVGCDGGVWRTVDGGASFQNANGNLNATQFYAVGVDANDPQRICGGAQDNGSLARGAGGDVWSLQAATGDGFVCAFNREHTGYVYASSYPSAYPAVYRSTAGLFGSYFLVTGSGSGIDAFDRISWVTPYVLDPDSPAVMYVGTHKLYKSTNNGSSWTRVGPSDFTGGSGAMLTIDVHPEDTAVVAVGTSDGRVWRSTTGGTSFTHLPGLPARAVNDVALDPGDPGHVLAVVGGFGTAHLWEWTGSEWGALGAGLPDVPANTVVLRTSAEIYVGVDTGLFRSTDGGRNFAPFMEGLPAGVVVTDLKLDPTGILTAGTYGRGAWQVQLPGLPDAGPGSVTGLLLSLLPGGTIEASWAAPCNAAELPGQGVSLQGGSLQALRLGVYSHAPVEDQCARTSPTVFVPAAYNVYYLAVPTEGGREGSAGIDSAGTPRPQGGATCGPREEGTCP